MADEKKLKGKINQEDDSDGETGTGGKSGHIEFRDFLAPAERQRDDLLPFDEKKRLLSVHNTTHEGRVKKQKTLREQRKEVKEGKVALQTYREGLSASNSSYRAHPVLSHQAQFSGVDRQVNAVPTENIAETNDENRNNLENQYKLRFAPQNAPKFNPKPLPR